MSTLRQKKAVKEIVENGGIVSKAMKDTGYSENTAKTPQKLTNSKGYKEEAKPFLDKLEKERDRIIKAMSEMNLSEEEYKDLGTVLDKVTGKIQLLSGGVTERVELIGEKDKEKIDKLFNDNEN